MVGGSQSQFLSLVLTVSVCSLSLVIVCEGAPEPHSAGSLCHLRRRQPWCAVKSEETATAIRSAKRVGAGLSELVLIGWNLFPQETSI